MAKKRIRRISRTPKLLAIPKDHHAGELNLQQRLVRQEEAFRLRVDEGLDYRAIAERMGVSRYTAYMDVRAITKLKYQGLIEKNELVLMEHEAIYDRIMAEWLPLLKPLIEGEIVVGETKVDRNGREYDITIPAFESAKAATEMINKTMAQRERIHGYIGAESKGKISPEDAGEVAVGVMKALYNATLQKPAEKIIRAEEV